MKVQINNTVKRFSYDGKKYLAGDILEVPESVFVPYIMTEIKEASAPVEVVPIEVKATDEPIIEKLIKKKSKPAVVETDESTATAAN